MLEDIVLLIMSGVFGVLLTYIFIIRCCQFTARCDEDAQRAFSKWLKKQRKARKKHKKVEG